MGMTNPSFGIVVTYPDRKEEDTIMEIHRQVQVNCTGNTFLNYDGCKTSHHIIPDVFLNISCHNLKLLLK